MKRTLPTIAAIACLFLLLPSCRKDTGKKTSCTSTLYGYSGVFHSTTPFSSCAYGIINPSTASLASIATVSASVYSNNSTYNTADNSMYVFRHGEHGDDLYKVNLGGAATSFTSATSTDYQGIIYHQASNKLYAIKYVTGANQIVELTISGSSYSESAPVSTLGTHLWASPITTAVDNATGDIYYALSNVPANSFSLEKYHPGSTPALITAGAGALLMGLQFNKNDGMLYAIRVTYGTSGPAGFEFVRINPAGGAVTSLSAISFPVNNEFYSTVLDDCTNRYIVTAMIDSASSSFSQFNMSGTMIQHDTVSGVLQGLEVVY